MRGWLLFAGALLIFVNTGCAKKESANSSSTAGQTPTATQPAAHGDETEQVDTSGSVADLIGRAHDEEHQLEQIIANAKLSDVHKKAFAIRDLVAAAADKASPSQKTALQPHVEEVRTVASALDEAGDSGDLARTKSEFKKLQMHLRAIEGVLGVKSH